MPFCYITLLHNGAEEMVITMELKHIILRGKTYHFRMPVPKDCVRKIGKTEIVQSLRTDNPLEAQKAAKFLEQTWANKFRAIRKPDSPALVKRSVVSLAEDGQAFKQGLIDLMEKNLPAIIDQENEKELHDRSDMYKSAIYTIQRNGRMGFDFPELDICWPLKPSKSPGSDRMRRRILVDVIKLMHAAVIHEIAEPPAEQLIPQKKEARAEPEVQVRSTKSCSEDHDILAVTELMLAAKTRIEKSKETIKMDIRLLMEWLGNKKDITAYSKKDLIDYVQNCLPYLPANIARRGNKYKGKTLRQCVEMTKTNPEQYPPISHTTCGNRLVNIIMVFNYAKDHLGIIRVNPAMGIEIPEVLVSTDLPRGFTPDEVNAMWDALQTVKDEVARNPSRYWTTILSLYHGFRLNEVCSLFLKDVYEDADGVFVIDINADGQFKSVKNQSSVRIVPVHPFVRDQLGFKSFVEAQKSARPKGVLFQDVKGNALKGYRDRMSKWFADWKKTWLAPEAQYKHFHDLRYTFIQTAQNQARMPDRHSQEITGHSIEGVSAVHLGYSGRLKPKVLLEELQKVKYGWEDV